MATLDQRIADLEETIKGYETRDMRPNTKLPQLKRKDCFFKRLPLALRLLTDCWTRRRPNLEVNSLIFNSFIVYVCMTLDQRIADLEEEIKGYVR